MREKGQTEAAKTLETPVFSRGIEILTEKSQFSEKELNSFSEFVTYPPPIYYRQAIIYQHFIFSNNKAGIFQSTGLIYLLLLVVPIQANNSLFTNSFNNCLVLGPFKPIFSATCSVLYSIPASIMAKIC